MRILRHKQTHKDPTMIILTNAVSEKTDEGCLKVAYSLVKRIKAKKPDTFVVSYGRVSGLTDRHLVLNKLLLNRKLIELLRTRNELVLYIPFPAKTIATALRTFIVSLCAPGPVGVLLVMKSPMNWLARLLLRLSGVNLIVLSRDAERFYQEILPAERIYYMKTGVDTRKFCPVSPEKARGLKIKYGLDPDRTVILHVGHLNSGRGIGDLLKLNPSYQVLLVVSTLTRHEQETELRQQLLQSTNIKIMDGFIPNIEEIYQLCDVYFFPVEESGHCIDVPLSCLEAASCNKPVITTDYGEMREFIGKSGFYYIKKHDTDCLNRMIEKVLRSKEPDSRAAVMDYDWDRAVDHLLRIH